MPLPTDQKTELVTTEELKPGYVVWFENARYNVFDRNELTIPHAGREVRVIIQRLGDDGRILEIRSIDTEWEHEWSVLNRGPWA